MSADDGVYIATYMVDDTKVYSVVHGHLPHEPVDNAHTFDRVWATGKLFTDKSLACLYAIELQQEVESEYGARMLEYVSDDPPRNVRLFKQRSGL